MENLATDRLDRRVVLLVTTMAAFLTPFILSGVNVALPSIGREFAMDAVSLGWVATSYLLAAAVFLVPFGRLADIHGKKKMFLSGVVIYTIAALLSAISSSPAMLISFRSLQGLSSAMMFGTGTAILISVFPLKDRGRVLGINVASTYLGLSLGPSIAGLLTQHFGWRSIFLVNVPIGLAIIALVLWKMRGEWAEAIGEKFDLTGSLVYCFAMIALIYGLTFLPALSAGGVLLAGIVGLVVFVRVEKRAAAPVLDVNIFNHNAVFAFSNLAALINYSATFAISFLLSLYLQYIKGFDPQTAGIVLIAMPVMQTIFSPLAGRLSDRVDPRSLASLGMGLTAVGLLSFSFLSNSTPLSLIIGGLMIAGTGFGFFTSPNTNAIMSAVERRFYGVASGVLGTMRLTGQMLSLAIAMLTMSLFVGKVQVTPEYYPAFLSSVKTSFIISTILCFAGIFVSLARGKRQHEF